MKMTCVLRKEAGSVDDLFGFVGDFARQGHSTNRPRFTDCGRRRTFHQPCEVQHKSHQPVRITLEQTEEWIELEMTDFDAELFDITTVSFRIWMSRSKSAAMAGWGSTWSESLPTSQLPSRIRQQHYHLPQTDPVSELKKWACNRPDPLCRALEDAKVLAQPMRNINAFRSGKRSKLVRGPNDSGGLGSPLCEYHSIDSSRVEASEIGMS